MSKSIVHKTTNMKVILLGTEFALTREIEHYPQLLCSTEIACAHYEQFDIYFQRATERERERYLKKITQNCENARAYIWENVWKIYAVEGVATIFRISHATGCWQTWKDFSRLNMQIYLLTKQKFFSLFIIVTLRHPLPCTPKLTHTFEIIDSRNKHLETDVLIFNILQTSWLIQPEIHLLLIDNMNIKVH